MLKAVRAQEERIALVEQGKADLTSSGAAGGAFPVSPASRALVRPHPQLGTVYLAFNTNRPPFDDPKARRALNYALDRNRVVRITGGEDVARPTCQVLPPNFPGYRRYCPYTLDPSADGSWTAPDAAEAARLIADSGTAGTRVTLWVPSFAGVDLGRYLRDLLKSLDYRVHVRSSFGPSASLDADENTDPFRRYFVRLETGAMSNRRGSPQIAWGGWGPDYPAASAFIQPLFSCRSKDVNYARICDHALEREMRDAAELEQTDRAAANRRWAELDREATDKALLVPLFNTYGADLVSKRVPQLPVQPDDRSAARPAVGALMPGASQWRGHDSAADIRQQPIRPFVVPAAHFVPGPGAGSLPATLPGASLGRRDPSRSATSRLPDPESWSGWKAATAACRGRRTVWQHRRFPADLAAVANRRRAGDSEHGRSLGQARPRQARAGASRPRAASGRA